MSALIFTTIASPIGPLTLVKSSRGLRHIFFEEEANNSLALLNRNLRGENILEASTAFHEEGTQLNEYFAGRLQDFTIALDHSVKGFVTRAQRALTSIPYAQTRTYQELAVLAGSPNAARAAGTACAQNPLPLVLPCHRVVPSAGGIGAYSGMQWRKEFLLSLERQMQPQ